MTIMKSVLYLLNYIMLFAGCTDVFSNQKIKITALNSTADNAMEISYRTQHIFLFVIHYEVRNSLTNKYVYK
jgi:hypothetical protein